MSVAVTDMINALLAAGFHAEKLVNENCFSFVVTTNAVTNATGVAGYVFVTTKSDDTHFTILRTVAIPGSLPIDLDGKNCTFDITTCVDIVREIKESIGYWHSSPNEEVDFTVGLTNEIVGLFEVDKDQNEATVEDAEYDEPKVDVKQEETSQQSHDAVKQEPIALSAKQEETTDDQVPESESVPPHECTHPLHAFVVMMAASDATNPHQSEAQTEFNRFMQQAFDKMSELQTEKPKPTLKDVLHESELLSASLNLLADIMKSCPYVTDPMMSICIHTLNATAGLASENAENLKSLVQ